LLRRLDHVAHRRTVQRQSGFAGLVAGVALLDETRQATVGEDLVAGLAMRAVRDLMALVADSAQGFAATRAQPSVPRVHFEVLTQFRFREPAGAAAFEREPVRENGAHSFE